MQVTSLSPGFRKAEAGVMAEPRNTSYRVERIPSPRAIEEAVEASIARVSIRRKTSG